MQYTYISFNSLYFHFLSTVFQFKYNKQIETKARFKRRILHAPNAIQTMHNEEAYLIIYCLNCIRCMQNSTFETGLRCDLIVRHYVFHTLLKGPVGKSRDTYENH